MASPIDGRTRPSSLERPALDRTITAPELEAALRRTKRTHFQPLDSSHTNCLQHSSTAASSIDTLNDLGHDQHDSATPTEHTATKRLSRFTLPTPQAWRTYFLQEVAGDKYLEFQLLLMTVATGILDAMTYTTYSVFTSKQTGNTLFLALYAFRSDAIDAGIEQNVGVSIGVFIAGAVFFGHIGHLTRQRRRIWLLVSNAFQALLILAAAAIRYLDSRERTGSAPLAILALLSFAESGQIANALNVNMPELNTTMVTGALIQLCTDRSFFHLHNAKRNRRLAFFASMLLGCFIGAAIVGYSTPSAALVVTAATKGLLFFLFFLNRGMVDRPVVIEDEKTNRMEGCATPASRVLWGD